MRLKGVTGYGDGDGTFTLILYGAAGEEQRVTTDACAAAARFARDFNTQQRYKDRLLAAVRPLAAAIDAGHSVRVDVIEDKGAA